MTSLLFGVFPGVLGAGLATVLALAGATSGVLAGHVRRKGFWLVRRSGFQQRARRRSEQLYEQATRATDAAGVAAPDRSVLVQLDAWALAVKEQVLLGVPVAVLAFAALAMGVAEALAAGVSEAAFLWAVLPAVALAVLSTLPMRLDDIALRRGHSADLVALAAMQLLAACDQHREHPSPESTIRLDDGVGRLSSALGMFARFGVTRSVSRRRRLVGQVAGMSAELNEALEAVYRDRSQLTVLVEKVARLLASMKDQCILALVSEEVGRSLERDEAEGVSPWGYVAAHVMSFGIGCGLLAVVRSLDLGSELVTVVVLPVVVLLMQIPYGLVRRSAGLRRLPRFALGTDRPVPGEQATEATDSAMSRSPNAG
ncbi:hypothetical protein [Kitasatospora sp. NPDC057015]|uniref:hypothetical protein n=1 Tax=Kitasatospora sp. NPDC057015 TaxID=3346001 RepID=UPI003624F29B